MNKENIFEKEGYVMPVIILTVICLVVSGILGYVNGLTAPIIEAANIEAANQAKMEIVPSAKSFDIINMDFAKGINEVAKADTGDFVITSSASGKNGDVKVIVGIKDGKIIGTKCLAQEEDAGIGNKITTDQGFIAAFNGKDVSNVDGVATISGATISSTAYKNAVKNALSAYEMARKG